MEQTKNIVILGGGYAGVHAANIFLKEYRKNHSVEITLIDKNHFHTLMTELHEVAGGRIDKHAIQVSYRKIFGRKRINIVKDEISSIDFQNKTLNGRHDYPYDTLLIATGGQPADFGIKGIKEHAFTLWSMEDACRIRKHVEECFERAAIEDDVAERNKLLTFVIAGAGFTGIEMVGELIEWIPTLCETYGIPETCVTLINVEALSQILPIIPQKIRAKALSYLKNHGVDVRTNTLITEVEPDKFYTKNGEVYNTYTMIWTCGVKACDFLDSLPLEGGPAGRKIVDEFMHAPDQKDVYIAGDGIWFMENEKPVPQIVEAAEQTAATAANNMVVDLAEQFNLRTKRVQKTFKSSFHGHMVSIGGRYGVAHNMGISTSGFFAMSIKHAVNFLYLTGICGVNGFWTYLKEQIIDIGDRRSFVGGFFNWRVPGYWTFLLRIYLGFMWLQEGYYKITGGWLDRGNDFVSMAEVGSGASEVVEEVVEAISAASSGAVTGASEAISYAVPLIAEPTALYSWITMTFVNRMPYLFQSGIVFYEILIGLAFIGGLFTWLSAATSILLSIMLILGAMTDASIFWFIFAAIVMMGGAGRCMGLDYWVMPWARNQWNKTTLAQNTHLYVGEPRRRGLKRKF